ncbi:ABC transporter ATP-binding protein [Brachybacterium saurashtrense]|uniref:ABC transporter ATP-binding protein n=1 Tax=Brachybacterium saurashtrense TaxID=556288 RepID=A0A345YQQ7_9MICO|nr:ABC transporter ATP-binding protein [Brachybacterium saurashtrense]AXK46259.1 ABC transporter ATP-binding protein [Brachybacterium saurashtrense]RRR23999.1 ABC transporter ATP-binding protein [Brachybacterium saurashtrense]
MLWTLVRRHLRPYLPHVVAVAVLQLATVLATLYLPSLNADIIDNGVATGDTDYIWRVGGLMLVVAMVQVITAIAAVWCGARVAMGVGRDIRRSVYTRVDRFSTEEMGRYGAPTLITRGTNDVQQVQMLVLMTLNFMVMVPIMSIGGIIMAVQEDPGLSWLVWVSVPVLLVIVGFLVARLMPLFQRMQDNIDAINGVMREQIMGIRVVRAFVREEHETARFRDANATLTDTSVRIGRLFVLMGPAITIVLHLATAAVLWFGGHRVDDGLVQVGALTAFMQYLLQILMAVMMGTFMVMMLPRAVISARRIGEVLETAPTLHEPAQPVPLPAADGGASVEFRDVTFAYPGAEAPVLDGLSFTAEAGRTTAIIGATGSGKTTLVSLIPRLHDATSGQVLLDGVPVTDLARADIAATVGLVPQKPYLFSGTIAHNLRFGDPSADETRLWEALEVARGDGFVRERTTGEGETLATGLDSTVSQGGTTVSGGQRQRLCIARTLVAAPRVYVFDDSFSALDVTTDAEVSEGLARRTRGATTIIVAQRISTITSADQILVLEEGRIVGHGTHQELLASSETYREIVDSQITVEERA